MQTDSTQAAHELGDASFYLHDYHFRQDNHNGICTLQPQNRQGYGNIYQVQPTDGLFLSTGSWIPYASMERKYEINQKLVKNLLFGIRRCYPDPEWAESPTYHRGNPPLSK